jgi:hypothetical protein
MNAVPAVILLLVIALVLFVVGRMAWRFFRGDIEPEAGGSLGRQFLGREKDEKPEDIV